MKRHRDDAFVDSSQPNRPAISSPVEPSGHVQMSTATSAQRMTATDALTYLRTLKEEFQDKKETYDKFLEVMKDFKAQRIDTSGVIMRVKGLFKGRPDLILGFNTFLPKGSEITLPLEDESLLKKKPVQYEEAIGFVNRIKTRFQGDDRVYKAFIDILNMYKNDYKSISKVYQEVSVLLRDHADLLVDLTHFLPAISGAASVHLTQPGTNLRLRGDDKDPSLTMARNMNAQKYDDADWKQQNHIDKENRENNDGEHHGDLDQIRKFAHGDDSVTSRSNRGAQELGSTFCEKVKERLQDAETYEKFLDCVRSYKQKFVAAPQFRKLVSSVLETYPDLIEESEDFITYIEKTEHIKSQNRQIFRSSNVDQGDENCDREDKEIINHDNRENDRYDRCIFSSNKDILSQRMSPYMSKDKFTAKPIHELDLSNCKSCTPSYRLLPENYPIPVASCRTKIGAGVLNDHWVSVTSGSEDYSFKHMRKNQYEESLFHCEDDRFELDMLLEPVNATAKRVEELLDNINSQIDKTESTFCINDHLTALDLRCIERLYGEHGLDVMDVLRKNAPLALPVILTRLKQKQEEWARCRADFSKIWAEIYAKNYHKSLDHRSFYFKQQDTKILSTKALLAEIKEISERSEMADETVLTISAGYKQSIRPHMEFTYADFVIHEDLYQLMNYATREVCTPEQHDKVMKIWTNFLETILGISPRPLSVLQNLKDTDDANVNNGPKNESSAISENFATKCDVLCDGSLEPLKNRNQDPNASAPTNMEAEGEELFGNVTVAEIDSNGDGEGEENGLDSLDGVNASENDDLSVSESANAEKSAGVPDQDGTHNKNTVVESEGETDRVSDVDGTDEIMSDSDRFLQTVKPLATKSPMALHGKEQNSQIFFANDSFYLLFKFHYMLYERIQSAKMHSTYPENKWRTSNPSDSYHRFKEALHSLLDRSSDNAKFEDDCRAIIGAQSYVLFTLDKLIHKLLKQLQTIATEDVENKLLQLYAYESSRNPEKFRDVVYHENARFLLPDDNLYRIECFSCSPMRLTIQLMKNDHDNRMEPTAVLMDPDFASYLHSNLLSVVDPERFRSGLFSKRHKRRFSTGNGEAAMEGVVIRNGLEMKVNAKTMKAAYVLGTEDFFYRTTERRLAMYGAVKGYAKLRKSTIGLE